MSTDTSLVLFKNVVRFDSRTGELIASSNVLVRDELIDGITVGDKLPAGSDGATIIDGGGKTLIPGLIDAHSHSMSATIPLVDVLTADMGYISVLAGRGAGETLMRGFTTLRDTGGPSFGLKRAIDSGVIPGPRIFPAGAMISQTGGHSDFRQLYEVPRGICGCHTHTEIIGASCICDGVPEVLRGVREQLMQGASQVKLMAGGGVASPHDSIDVTQFTLEEMRAAVAAAENHGTYVLVHAYTPEAVQQALTAGVRCIDHGQLIDEETVKMIKDAGAWWSLQPFLDDQDMVPEPNPLNQAKALQVAAGTENAYKLAKKHNVKVAWGTDTLFDPDLATRQGEQLAKMVRWYTPAEVLTMATATNAQLLELSGLRNPYPQAPLGVVEEGAFADLLLIDGNPVEDITLIAKAETSMVVIMKNGTIHKNILGS